MNGKIPPKRRKVEVTPSLPSSEMMMVMDTPPSLSLLPSPLHYSFEHCDDNGGEYDDDKEDYSFTIETDRNDGNGGNGDCIIGKERLIDNFVIVSAMAINLYLEPTTVMNYCLYWTSQYSNNTLKREWWFNDLIKGIISRPVSLSLLSDLSYPTIKDQYIEYRYLFSFIGTPLNRVPLTIFASQRNSALMYSMEHIIHPDNQCFLQSSNGGLRGEASIDLFKYNFILEFFFEPSFIIITCFNIVLPILVHSTVEQVTKKLEKSRLKLTKKVKSQLQLQLYTYFIPYIEKLIKSIDVVGGNGDRVIHIGCFNRSHVFHKENLLRFKQDMVYLKNIVEDNLTDLIKMKIELNQFWSDKASFCSKMKEERLKYIMTQYVSSI
jgi:hypothetical protein